MNRSDYRDLRVWKEARALVSHIYRLTAAFPKYELFGLTSQMRRAALSVPCNIAEGHGRRTTADRIQFLVVARGSLFELETQAIIAADLEYLTTDAGDYMVARTTDVICLLNGYIRHCARQGR